MARLLEWFCLPLLLLLFSRNVLSEPPVHWLSISTVSCSSDPTPAWQIPDPCVIVAGTLQARAGREAYQTRAPVLMHLLPPRQELQTRHSYNQVRRPRPRLRKHPLPHDSSSRPGPSPRPRARHPPHQHQRPTSQMTQPSCPRRSMSLQWLLGLLLPLL